MLVIVRQAQPDSATFKAMNAEWQRTPELLLMQSVEHSLRWLTWAKSEDARTGRNVPEPWRFPWDPEPDDGSIKGDAMTVEEAADWLGWSREMTAHLGDNG